MTEEVTFKTLLEEVKTLYNTQIEDIKNRVEAINKNIDSLTTHINKLLVEYSKFQVHIETKNGNQIHHIPPCTSLDNIIKEFNKFCLEQSKVYTGLIDDVNNINKEISKIDKKISCLEEEDKKITSNFYKQGLNVFNKKTKIISLVVLGVGSIIAILTFLFTYVF